MAEPAYMKIKLNAVIRNSKIELCSRSCGQGPNVSSSSSEKLNTIIEVKKTEKEKTFKIGSMLLPMPLRIASIFILLSQFRALMERSVVVSIVSEKREVLAR